MLALVAAGAAAACSGDDFLGVEDWLVDSLCDSDSLVEPELLVEPEPLVASDCDAEDDDGTEAVVVDAAVLGACDADSGVAIESLVDAGAADSLVGAADSAVEVGAADSDVESGAADSLVVSDVDAVADPVADSEVDSGVDSEVDSGADSEVD